MLYRIKFKNDKYSKKDEGNIFGELTKNTIVLCSDTEVKSDLTKEIIDTLNQRKEYNDYCCDDEDIKNCKTLINFLTTTILQFGDQTIVLSVEPTCTFKAKYIEDMWFCCKNKSGKINIYPISVFKNSKEKWDEGIIEIYKCVCNGIYGTYDGNYLK